MKDFKSVVARRIKAARVAAGYGSQAALADDLGVDQSRVARWESGENLPRGSHRANLLKALHKKEIEIFGHEEASPTVASQPVSPDIIEAIERGAAQVLAGKTDDLSDDKRELIALIPRLEDGLVRQILGMLDEYRTHDSKSASRRRNTR